MGVFQWLFPSYVMWRVDDDAIRISMDFVMMLNATTITLLVFDYASLSISKMHTKYKFLSLFYPFN